MISDFTRSPHPPLSAFTRARISFIIARHMFDSVHPIYRDFFLFLSFLSLCLSLCTEYRFVCFRLWILDLGLHWNEILFINFVLEKLE